MNLRRVSSFTFMLIIVILLFTVLRNYNTLASGQGYRTV